MPREQLSKKYTLCHTIIMTETLECIKQRVDLHREHLLSLQENIKEWQCSTDRVVQLYEMRVAQQDPEKQDLYLELKVCPVVPFVLTRVLGRVRQGGPG